MSARARGLAAAVALLAAGCVSATSLDFRLTRIGRAAVPRLGQSLSQQVTDASQCRIAVMDRLFYVGSYAFSRPPHWGAPDAGLLALELEMVNCLRDLGYELPERPARPPDGSGRRPGEG